MKLPNHLIVLLGLSVLLLRCEEPVELDLPIPDPKLVLVSNFFPDELVEVRLSYSQSVLTSDNFPTVYGAEIYIFEGDNRVEEDKMRFVEGDDTTTPYYTTQTFKPQVGIDYTVQAIAPGYDPVNAVSSIPAPVPIVSFLQQSSVDSRPLPNGKRIDNVEIEIDYEDPLQLNTYYHLRLLQEIEICRPIPGSTHLNCGGSGYSYWTAVSFPSNGAFDWEVVTASSGGGILIKDKPLEGALPLSVQSELELNERLGRLSAELRVVSQAYYDFNSSLSIQLGSNDDPFQEPGPINNNVDNGLGVFAGYNYARDTLFLDL